MDTVKIGVFLSKLRRERNMTQEELGEILGVTNKTISRWEKGNYLPPVEMLQKLSAFYHVSINEILSGERLSQEEYVRKAEENVTSALESAFSLKEKIAFYRKKWLKDHLAENIFFFLITCIFLILYVVRLQVFWCMVYVISSLVIVSVQRNRMMIYVEARAFDGSGRQ